MYNESGRNIMEYKQAKIELEVIGRELHAYLDEWKKEGFTRTQDFIRYAVKAIDMQTALCRS
jgi:hypothetical protein